MLRGQNLADACIEFSEVNAMKDKLMHKVSTKFDIPSEILTNEPLIEIRGSGRVSIDHHTAILEYTPQRIHVATQTGLVAVQGENLTIVLLTRTRMVIEGSISSVVLG